MIQIPIELAFALGLLTGGTLLFLYLEFIHGKEVQEAEYEVCGSSTSVGYQSFTLRPKGNEFASDSKYLRDIEKKGLAMTGIYRVKFFHGFVTKKLYILYIDPIMTPRHKTVHV